MVLPEAARVSGLICLQGGAEFGARCVDMDTELLERSPAGNVAVLAGAAAPGREYEMASRNAVDYYTRLTDRTVIAVDDPRVDPSTFIAVADDAGVVVLPGGSPRRLLDVLSGAVRQALLDVHARGGSISGASAGAMVLCTYTVTPRHGLAEGLGLVPGVAIPHFDGSNWWELPLPPGVPRWGLPECGGIFYRSGVIEAVGSGDVERMVDGRRDPIERSSG